MLDRNNFTGPWAGVPTAWNPDGTFDEITYRRDVRACCEAGAPGVYTHGTTGEFYAMELDEWQAVCTAAVDQCRIAKTPIALGVTSTYTQGAVRRARIAADLGAGKLKMVPEHLDERPPLLHFNHTAFAVDDKGNGDQRSRRQGPIGAL